MCDLSRHPNYSQCAACGECFTSDSAFDAHLGRIPRKGRPKCKRPQDVRKGESEYLLFDAERQAWRWAGRENPYAKPSGNRVEPRSAA